MESPLIPCATCTAPCCVGEFYIDADDYERLRPEEQALVAFPPGLIGHPGRLPSSPCGRCQFSTQAGCLVHPRKPKGCARLDPWTCGLYEEDPEKKAGLVKFGLPLEHQD